MEDEDVAGKGHHRAHHVLDEHDRHAGVLVEVAQHCDHAIRLGRPETRHNLVEKQQLRIGGKRTRHLQALAVGKRERGGRMRALVEEIEPAQQFARMLLRVGNMRTAEQPADDDVLLDRQAVKRAHDLEGPPDTEAADRIRRPPFNPRPGEGDRSGVGRQHAGDHVEEGRLARAVRSDDAAYLARRHIEIDPVHCGQSAKVLADAADGKKRHRSGSPSPRRRESHGQIPPGSAVTTNSRHIP
jgi:hypothetical protein